MGILSPPNTSYINVRGRAQFSSYHPIYFTDPIICQKIPIYLKIFDINNKSVVYSRVIGLYEEEPANFYFDDQIKNTNHKIITGQTHDENNNNSSINKLNFYLTNTSSFKGHNHYKTESNESQLNTIKTELENMKKIKSVYNNIKKKIQNNTNIIALNWIFKYKRNSEGKIIQRKARLSRITGFLKLGLSLKVREGIYPN
ncbi:hypothetical protein H8356DRAFT_1431170 [Neocallimastix lanati (nom. inval.)]|nr:hypothetical protein H8356DRAFT_1431170 [Neocallimastix sp. JGI-2020a]